MKVLKKGRKSMLARWFCIACIVLTGFMLTACGSDNQKISEEEQLGTPNSDDTVAIFHVKDYGDISVRFFAKTAPKAVENFIKHAQDGYYNGITFHRVINDFMIQGGDPTGTGAGGESIWGNDFENECVDNILPIRGALCMANRGADTNGSQFFIVQTKEAVINSESTLGMTEEQIQFFKDHGGCPHLAGSYTVFGQVLEGMDVVDAIASVPVDKNSKPVNDVIIDSITITTYGSLN